VCVISCNKLPCEPELDRLKTVYVDDTFQLTGVAISPEERLLVKGVYQNSHKLVRIDLATGYIEHTDLFEDAAKVNSYVNDEQVDNQRQYAYLANNNEGGIVVMNLASGNSRQVLQDHYSTRSDPAFRFMIDGQELMKNGEPVKINSHGIAVTPDGDWLYYKPLTDDKLYRVRTEHLRNDTMSSAALGTKVEDLGHFAATDGMIFDKKGNLYIGDLQDNAIKRITPDLRIQTLIRDERLIWPGGYSISEDGYLYISCSQKHKQPEYNNGINKRTSPYTIYKLKLP